MGAALPTDPTLKTLTSKVFTMTIMMITIDHAHIVMLMLTNAENFDLQDVVVTEWTIGATAVAGWGQVCFFLTGFYLSSSQLVREPDYMTIHNPNQRDSFQVANHGGGYSYRLCKLGPGEPPSEQVTVMINVVMVMINIMMVMTLMPVIKRRWESRPH